VIHSVLFKPLSLSITKNWANAGIKRVIGDEAYEDLVRSELSSLAMT